MSPAGQSPKAPAPILPPPEEATVAAAENSKAKNPDRKSYCFNGLFSKLKQQKANADHLKRDDLHFFLI
jgi:hypothetical protein